VLLLRRIPLHGEDELLAHLWVLRPPQFLPHRRGS
jgi:DNA polymerase IIIc chi subunit